jgi:hypothetical protein
MKFIHEGLRRLCVPDTDSGGGHLFAEGGVLPSFDGFVSSVGSPNSNSEPNFYRPADLKLSESLWVQLDNLKHGDILSIYSESSHYQFVFVGKRCGLLVSSNSDVPSGLYYLHGACPFIDPLEGDSAASAASAGSVDTVQTVSWGTLQVGARALFASNLTPNNAIRTSKVVRLGVVRAGSYNSPYAVTTPVPAVSASMSAGQTSANKPVSLSSISTPNVPKPSLGTTLKPLGKPAVSVLPKLNSGGSPKFVSKPSVPVSSGLRPPVPKPSPIIKQKPL